METTDLSQRQGWGGKKPLEDLQKQSDIEDRRKQLKVEEKMPKNEEVRLSNDFDIFECPPPKTENELLQMFYRQQEEIRRLRGLIHQRDVQIKQLELELRNLCMDTGNH
ncbi:PREDICTED: coronin-2A-like [Calidris pugnax]|uniref:coronin-2A-like n=1 Tax=Calidris pugnax TaxID=198806 RepID=UPI00071C281B|nr:PREDICTED: coronin-2A-like [Calidris pugnax]XP_014811885.1 PREDICTED: coronin-2A-like [Calidris pugnax]